MFVDKYSSVANYGTGILPSELYSYSTEYSNHSTDTTVEIRNNETDHRKFETCCKHNNWLTDLINRKHMLTIYNGVGHTNEVTLH